MTGISHDAHCREPPTYLTLLSIVAAETDAEGIAKGRLIV
jgi:hypothetical protein